MQVQQAIQSLCGLGIERLDAQMLVLHVLQRPMGNRAWLLAHSDDEIAAAEQQHLTAFALRRRQGEPMAYITGHKEFYGLDLQVDARVLDPRADTETLVDWVLDVIPSSGPIGADQSLRVMDLGTGSGAVALAIQHQRPKWQVHALDYSADALAVAHANAERLKLPVVFRQGSWLQNVNERFHVIASNPPYIALHDQHLDALRHEPLAALASGTDGLDDIRTIIVQAPRCLEPGGRLLLEHGYDQADAVRELLRNAGFLEVQSRTDLAGIERCSGGCWPPTNIDTSKGNA
jgi:release factor glutamine methyltransferase